MTCKLQTFVPCPAVCVRAVTTELGAPAVVGEDFWEDTLGLHRKRCGKPMVSLGKWCSNGGFSMEKDVGTSDEILVNRKFDYLLFVNDMFKAISYVSSCESLSSFQEESNISVWYIYYIYREHIDGVWHGYVCNAWLAHPSWPIGLKCRGWETGLKCNSNVFAISTWM